MVRAQYCSEWTELGYCMACLFDSFVPRRLMKAQPLLRVATYGFCQEGHCEPNLLWYIHVHTCTSTNLYTKTVKVNIQNAIPEL